MKTFAQITLTAILILSSSCKKEDVGSINYFISYQTANTSTKSLELAPSQELTNLHSQFGSYITSITPKKIHSKFQTIRFYDSESLDQTGHMIELIDNNLPNNDTLRYADFSAGRTVSIIPNIYGSDRVEGSGFKSSVTFIYFSFTLKYFFQEFDLPTEYENLCLNQFVGIHNNTTYFCNLVKNGVTIKSEDYPFTEKLFNSEESGWLYTYIYGGIDSDKIIYPTIEEVPAALLKPFGNQLNNTFVWSKNFAPFTLHVPAEDETKNIVCTISFDSNNLIQVYAGADNIAYTQDDQIVYAPNFWNRINVTITEN